MKIVRQHEPAEKDLKNLPESLDHTLTLLVYGKEGLGFRKEASCSGIIIVQRRMGNGDRTSHIQCFENATSLE